MTAKPALTQSRTQVLVVGAGPVGLLAALRLRCLGVEVRVIEQQSEPRTRTFPVVLHPQTLRILSELGLSAALFWRGRPVTRLAVYTDHERRAVLELPKVKGIPAGALTLPQDILRQALTNALSEAGVTIEWDTRLAVLAQDARSVWGRMVQHAADGRLGTSCFDADYLIGADGYESTVRESIGAELIEHGSLSSFAFFDAVTRRSGREAQLALTDDSSSAVYPMQDNSSRFSFQMSRALDRAPDEPLLRELVASRLPWYSADVEHCTWSGVAEFRRALSNKFGSGRIWLAGEAAHLTGPLGVQSLNIGLDEADELGRSIADGLRHPSGAAFGPEYEAKRQLQWRELLGLEPRGALSPRTPSWARSYQSRLLPCLPASEADLDDLLDQLRLSGSDRADRNADA